MLSKSEGFLQRFGAVPTSRAKPFLKWAGGKGQLLPDLNQRLPAELQEGKITKYVEPFIGGGAMFFNIVQNYSLKETVICDANPDLILAYQVIKHDVNRLVFVLNQLERLYLPMSEPGRKRVYENIRKGFNLNFDYEEFGILRVKRAAHLIFLNKTCFNGLYRVNSKGQFNTPVGNYISPKILDEQNLRKVSALLENTRIIQGDFSQCLEHITPKTFVYCDPPYRPLNKTSSFNNYASGGFDDEEQKRLAKFIEAIDKKGAKVMMSNSDPKNFGSSDEFFDELYKEYQIDRVQAKRHINSNAEKRGAISEIVVRNYL